MSRPKLPLARMPVVGRSNSESSHAEPLWCLPSSVRNCVRVRVRVRVS